MLDSEPRQIAKLFPEKSEPKNKTNPDVREKDKVFRTSM